MSHEFTEVKIALRQIVRDYIARFPEGGPPMPLHRNRELQRLLALESEQNPIDFREALEAIHRTMYIPFFARSSGSHLKSALTRMLAHYTERRAASSVGAMTLSIGHENQRLKAEHAEYIKEAEVLIGSLIAKLNMAEQRIRVLEEEKSALETKLTVLTAKNKVRETKRALAADPLLVPVGGFAAMKDARDRAEQKAVEEKARGDVLEAKLVAEMVRSANFLAGLDHEKNKVKILEKQNLQRSAENRKLSEDILSAFHENTLHQISQPIERKTAKNTDRLAVTSSLVVHTTSSNRQSISSFFHANPVKGVTPSLSVAAISATRAKKSPLAIVHLP
jgi:hypothetical protein